MKKKIAVNDNLIYEAIVKATKSLLRENEETMLMETVSKIIPELAKAQEMLTEALNFSSGDENLEQASNQLQECIDILQEYAGGGTPEEEPMGGEI